ncbi:MAG: hypothetical protein RLZZ67_315 [Candidatus Parcubacteria bacterium]|jgi:hypothetical protein
MKKIFLIISALIVLAGLLWFLTHSKSETIIQTQGVTGDVTPPKGVYKSSLFGFEITPAPGFTVNESYLNQDFGPGREIPGIAFIIPELFSKGTNLSADSYIAVEKLSDVDCEPASFIDSPQAAEDIVVDGISFKKASVSDAGAGNRYDQTVFVTENDGACIAVREFVHTTQIANYDPGTVKEYDRAGLSALFETMLKSLRL